MSYELATPTSNRPRAPRPERVCVRTLAGAWSGERLSSMRRDLRRQGAYAALRFRASALVSAPDALITESCCATLRENTNSAGR